MEEIRKQLDIVSDSEQGTRSAMAVYKGCLGDGRLDVAAVLREEARIQAMNGAKAFLEAAAQIEKMPPNETVLDRPSFSAIIARAEAGLG